MRRILPVVLAAALLLGACGDDGGVASPAETGDVVVKMKGNEFEPADVTVKSGQTVQWINEDSIDHNAVAKDGEVPKSDLFGQGGSYDARFTEAGKIEYVCTIHPGMEGTITVE